MVYGLKNSTVNLDRLLVITNRKLLEKAELFFYPNCHNFFSSSIPNIGILCIMWCCKVYCVKIIGFSKMCTKKLKFLPIKWVNIVEEEMI